MSVPLLGTEKVCCNLPNPISQDGVVKIHDFNIVYTNSRSLCNKSMELEYIISEEKANLIVVTETWFSSDKELKIYGYVGYYSS